MRVDEQRPAAKVSMLALEWFTEGERRCAIVIDEESKRVVGRIYTVEELWAWMSGFRAAAGFNGEMFSGAQEVNYLRVCDWL